MRSLIGLLAPLAPHLAEELWASVGGSGSVHHSRWPEVVESAAVDSVEVVVQTDGRVRDRIWMPLGADVATVAVAAMASPRVDKALVRRVVDRIVHVPNRLVNLVTSPSG